LLSHPTFPTRRSSDLGTFTATHQYLDDDPSGTTSDIYSINVTLADDDGGQDTETTTVTVLNVAPSITSVSLDTNVIDEGGNVTLDRKSTRLNSSHVKI